MANTNSIKVSVLIIPIIMKEEGGGHWTVIVDSQFLRESTQTVYIYFMVYVLLTWRIIWEDHYTVICD